MTSGPGNRTGLLPRQGNTRRRFLGGVMGTMLIAGTTVLPEVAWGPPTVRADGDMCAGDPILTISGKIISIRVSVPKARASEITTSDPVVVRVYVPSNLRVDRIVYTGQFPETTSIVTVPAVSGKTVAIAYEVYAPHAAGSLPYTVIHHANSQIASTSGAGVSGTWLPGSITANWGWLSVDGDDAI